MKTGDRVIIESPGIGTCVGTIVDISTPEVLPALEATGGRRGLAVLQKILDELEVTRLYMVEYRPDARHPQHGLLFAVLETRDGKMHDLRQQPITLTQMQGRPANN